MSTGVNISIKLTENSSQIEKLILDQIQAHFNSIAVATSIAIREEVKIFFENAILSEPTWQSLKDGKLKAEFGLDNTEERLREILNIWLSSIKIDYKPATHSATSIKGGITLTMIKIDWEDVLSAPSALVFTKLGDALPWLEWLLIYGDKIIIREYEVVMKSSPTSRSGMALMAKKKSGRWRVPPEFSGTSNNNFITKLLDNMTSEIENIIETQIVNRF